MKSKSIGKLSLFLAFTLAGSSVITGYVLSEKLGSFTITAISMGIVLISLLPFYAVKTIRTINVLTTSDWQQLFMQAFFGIFLFRIFMLLGLRGTSASEAGILTGANPAITAILACMVLKERFTRWTIIGIACTGLGITFLQGASLTGKTFSVEHTIGNILVLCAAASEALFKILSRMQKTESRSREIQIDSMVQTLLVAAIALVLSIVPALAEQNRIFELNLDIRDVLALIWYGPVVTALAYMLFYEGIKRCDAYTAAAFSGMIPLSSMILAVCILKEQSNFLQWLGAGLIVASILFIGRPKRYD